LPLKKKQEHRARLLHAGTSLARAAKPNLRKISHKFGTGASILTTVRDERPPHARFHGGEMRADDEDNRDFVKPL
jgi:hypothetical protein